MDLDRTKVRIDAKLRAQSQQRRFRTNWRIRAPLRPANGAKQHAVGCETAFESVFGQTVAELVDGDTTEGQLFKHELVLMLHGHRA